MIAAPLSIPSPPEDSRIVAEIGTWIHSWLPIWPEAWVLPIHAYALCILVGMVLAVLVINLRLSARGGEPWLIVDVGVWGVLFGIIGARLYHVLTHPDDYFPNFDPLSLESWRNIIAIWDGGGAIFGALIGGAFGIWLGCRFIGLRFWSVADAIAPALLLAQGIGRIGNWFNQELFGLPTDLPWGLEIDRPNSAIPDGIGDTVLFHPTFLYELIWNLVGFVLIVLIENRVRRIPGKLIPALDRRDFWQWGKVLGLYLVWYGVGRVWFESIRLDPSETFLGIRSNVWAALLAIVLGLLIIVVQSKRHTGVEPDVYLPGRRPEIAGVDSEDTYSDSDEPGDAAAEVTDVAATSGSTRKS